MAQQLHLGAVMNHCGTYNLILASESEDKGRSIAETLIYAVLILSAVVSIISAAASSAVVPSRVAATDCKTEYCA